MRAVTHRLHLRGGGGGQAEACLQGGVEGVFLKGSERPEAGQPRRILIIGLHIALNRTPNLDCYWEGAVPKV